MKKKRARVPALGLLFFASVLGCSPDDIGIDEPFTLVSLSVTPVSPGIAPGTAVQLAAVGTYSNNTKRTLTASVTWESSDPAVASVSNQAGSKGLASAVATGSTMVTAALGNIAGSTMLSVSPVSSISLSPASPPSMAPGTTQQLTATALLEGSKTQNLTSWATWTSFDTAIATVDNSTAKGCVTAVSAAGAAVIEAGFGTAASSVTITTSDVQSIAVTPSNPSIPNGTKQQFTATGSLEDSTVQNLTTWATWSSSDTGVATISNSAGAQGLASSASAGTSLITAGFSGVTSPAATLIVTDAILTSIQVTPTSVSIPLGNAHQFTATGTYTGGAAQDITALVSWTSSNPGVATVSNATGSKGLVTPVAQGSCTVNATLSGVTSNSASVTVTSAQLQSIVIAPSSAGISTGATQQFIATGIYTDGTTNNLTTAVNWTSSDSNIATVSSAGLAAAGSIAGSTDISASLSGIDSNIATLSVNYY